MSSVIAAFSRPILLYILSVHELILINIIIVIHVMYPLLKGCINITLFRT